MRLSRTSLLLVVLAWTSAAGAQAPAAGPVDAEALKKTCDKGSAADCLTLAGAYARGEGAPRDASKAAGFYKKACDGGQPPGCFELATMHVAGQGGPKGTSTPLPSFHRPSTLNHPNTP